MGRRRLEISRGGPAEEFLGSALILVSAVAFGFLPIFARLAYSVGAGVWELLFVRFAMAFALLGVALAVKGRLHIPDRRCVAILLLLGGVGYFLQSTLYFSALIYAPVSVVSLILYTYPALVTAASFLLGLERPSGTVLLNLAAAMCGIVLVADPVFEGASTGVLLALGAALVYTCYIIVSSRVLKEVSGELATFFVLGGATASFGMLGAVGGFFAFWCGLSAWLWATAISLVSTVLALTLFFKGLSLVGPSKASILSTAEVATSVIAATIIFEEGLSPTQVGGGVLIIAAAISSAVSGIRRRREKLPRQFKNKKHA
ncbi:MAG: DMT family transporter [Candidatus Verstraetearchaeota archaeon]|nr:DMT family transporter [Candidatus Verstraetearchaeota archaeon]